jgi:acetylornithine deacetylase
MNSAISLLHDLVKIPSVSSLSNRPVVEYASRQLHESGWQTRPFPYYDSAGNEKINLIAVPPGQDPSNCMVDLAFVCHTDTVPYDPTWTEATQPVLRAGFLHGCGACDVKGFLASLLATISDLSPANFRRSICIALTADEEVGCIGASKLVALRPIAPKHVVVGEPTSLHPARAGKGYCLAEIRVYGKEAHSAHPSEGISAIHRAAHLVLKIEEIGARLRGERHDAFDPPFTTVNIGKIQGGTAKNIVAGECRLLLEWRPLPRQDTRQVVCAVESAVEELRLGDPDFRHEVVTLRQQPGFDAGANSRFVQSLEQITGRSSVAIPFGTEASLFAPIAEDVVVFGPGDMRTAHSSRERVSAIELAECVAYLRQLMTSPGWPSS